jgi:hypothetical protein
MPPVADGHPLGRFLGAGTPGWVRGSILIAMAAGFVLAGGASLDLGPIESRLGIAAGEAIGPFGQLYGGWEPSLWPAPVAISRVWALVEGGAPTSGSVRWPAAIAGVLAGFLLSRRSYRTIGTRASVLTGLCWFGSVALIDRSAGAGLDLIQGFAVVAALDRILGRGADLVAGLWASFAFLAGGWPPLALIALAGVVVGRRETWLSARLLVPPILTAAAWSAWALSRSQAEAWAAAWALPLTASSAWGLAPGVVALGLPWSPLAILASSRSVRDGWPESGRALVLGWLQASGACLVVGTLVPGLAVAARVPALAGLAVVAAACLDRLWEGTVARAPRRGFLALATAIVAAWVALVVVAGIFLASAVPYYRGVAIVLIGLALGVGAAGLSAALRSEPRRAVLALLALAACLKLAHWGYYVPEWNYRRSQGPWGRAVGQWVMPNWPIYTVHTWEPDLAFATRHPFRQLRQPKSLAFQDGPSPRFVLLLGPEFENWPADAPPLTKVASFQDERGAPRVLARTAGPFSLRALIQSRRPGDEDARTR